MAKYFIEDTTLTGIAGAIRGKEGSSGAIPVADFASRIAGIETCPDNALFLESSEVVAVTPLPWQIFIIYAQDKFIVLHGDSRISCSKDGVDWTLYSTTLSDPYCVTYAQNRFVAVSNGRKAYSSTDGITWSSAGLPSFGLWRAVGGSEEYFAAVMQRSNIAAYSGNGNAWTQTTMPASVMWWKMATYSSRIVAIAVNTDIAAYSDDGVTWTQTTMPASVEWWDATYGDGKFVAVSRSSDDSSASAIAAYSDDGITWYETSMQSANTWCGVAYGNGRFVAVTDEDNAVNYSVDGITWSNVAVKTTIVDGDGTDVTADVLAMLGY